MLKSFFEDKILDDVILRKIIIIGNPDKVLIALTVRGHWENPISRWKIICRRTIKIRIVNALR